MIKTLQVICEVLAERERQDIKWGGPVHDDTHGPKDWCRFISERMDELPESSAEQRHLFIEVAALALAAIQSHDRLVRQ